MRSTFIVMRMCENTWTNEPSGRRSTTVTLPPPRLPPPLLLPPAWRVCGLGRAAAHAVSGRLGLRTGRDSALPALYALPAASCRPTLSLACPAQPSAARPAPPAQPFTDSPNPTHLRCLAGAPGAAPAGLPGIHPSSAAAAAAPPPPPLAAATAETATAPPAGRWAGAAPAGSGWRPGPQRLRPRRRGAPVSGQAARAVRMQERKVASGGECTSSRATCPSAAKHVWYGAGPMWRGTPNKHISQSTRCCTL